MKAKKKSDPKAAKRPNRPRPPSSGMQEKLLRKTRLDTLAAVAKVLGHEISNLLGGIETCVQVLRKDPHLTPDDLELLDILQSGSKRLQEMSSTFAFFKPENRLNFQPFVLGGLLGEVLLLLRSSENCSPSIFVSHDFRPPELVIEADRDRLRSALWHLLLNASEAMGTKGTLNVIIERRGDEVVISVSDTGPGIPTSLQTRIFEPFFTTKARGTGLGLALVYRVAEEHGGRIDFVTQPGRETCFQLTLPVEQKRQWITEKTME